VVTAGESRWWYAGLVGLVAAARLVELSVSRRNVRRLRERGAVEVGSAHYPWMVLVHAAFLIACPLEVFLLDRPWIAPLGATMLVLLAAAMAARYWVIATLGGRWSTRVLCLPGVPLVRRGPYRFLRHPNYAAVVVEMGALPLVHGAWWTAAVFGIANALVLRERIAVENAALARFAPATESGA
jgi:methyltransferase